MDYRRLGSTGITVSVIGFGTWGIGGRTPGATSYGETNDNVSRRALDEAFDRGITFYDTASVYGNGHSEELLGECFASRRDRVVIATKGGITPSFLGYDFSASALRTSLEGSLRRLRTDYVDLFQLHNAGPDVILGQGDIADVLNGFVAQGKIRAFGFSTPTPADALALIGYPGLSCFQVNFNMLDWRAMDIGLFDQALSCGIGIIARTPMAFGFLTGRYHEDATFSNDDHRSRWSRARVASWVRAAGDIMRQLNVPDDEQYRVALALQFCLSFKAIATVIPGMLSPEEVVSGVNACGKEPLTAVDRQRIEQIYRRYESELRL